jgi:hypothetical protein
MPFPAPFGRRVAGGVFQPEVEGYDLDMSEASVHRSPRQPSPRAVGRLSVSPVLLAAALVVLLMGVAVACPNCKDGVDTSDPDGLNVARGYFFSILLMLAMPFTLVGSFGCYVWREMRRQQRAEAAAAAESVTDATLP